MKNKKIIGFSFCLAMLAMSNATNAQNDPSFKQYRFNALTLNPAQAGANDYSDISVLGSQYWVGMPGAPQTATISGNFHVFDNFGMGASIVADEVGPVQSTSVNLVGAYHLKLNNKWKFSTGLKLTGMNQNVMLSELHTTDPGDPDMVQYLTTGLSFNAGFGFLLYSKKFYVGFSKPRVTAFRFNRMDMSMYVDNKSGYISYAGADLKLNSRLEIRPSVMTMYGYGGPLNLDLNVLFTANKLIDFGATYHLKGSVGAIIGLNVKDKLYIGYSYAYPVNKMNRVSVQSHELAIRLKLNKTNKKADSPRFFN